MNVPHEKLIGCLTPFDYDRHLALVCVAQTGTVDPYRASLPGPELTLLEERLAGAYTVEIAAFDEFTLLLDPAGARIGTRQLRGVCSLLASRRNASSVDCTCGCSYPDQDQARISAWAIGYGWISLEEPR